jgi:hypothetical protein
MFLSLYVTKLGDTTGRRRNVVEAKKENKDPIWSNTKERKSETEITWYVKEEN